MSNAIWKTSPSFWNASTFQALGPLQVKHVWKLPKATRTLGDGLEVGAFDKDVVLGFVGGAAVLAPRLAITEAQEVTAEYEEEARVYGCSGVVEAELGNEERENGEQEEGVHAENHSLKDEAVHVTAFLSHSPAVLAPPSILRRRIRRHAYSRIPTDLSSLSSMLGARFPFPP
ncbi:hypothetical protein BDV98DRAFT_585243 [Pterulicium gracile]|uniref:Uncharacterized protein n=1 Tax=Pterulicium gracile TaxID=1884261 RepID=A0A5C3Q714_9AGAR|nr:hypothetical protein BDV98DRAFT_585243 [Pterula gracilis]